ncbi:MAG: aminomethyl-transferring glycine dehydrogenase subunit GcvPB [Thermoplasmata archaeon]
MYRQAIYDEPLLYKKQQSREREGISVPSIVPEKLKRGQELNLPVLSELEVMRHYTRLSEMNFGIESGFYPLGSCTMKYNPKIAMPILSMPQLNSIHPSQPEETSQGILQVFYELEQYLSKISGMDSVTLQPPAGAMGEFTGLSIARAYFEYIGESRTEVIVPDSAHGTNPASASMVGYDVKEVPSNMNGMVDLDALKNMVSEKTAVLMLTNPNTLGIFDKNVLTIANIMHEKGALLYYDGANLNPLIGIATPGRMGFDIVHFNLHKSFGTPHGGGGPGAGPVGVIKKLEPFLPVPRIVYMNGKYLLEYNKPLSIGKVSPFFGNTFVLVMAYMYILRNGKEGLVNNALKSVANSNYMAQKLSPVFDMPYYPKRMHEFVLSLSKMKNERGIKALDVSKRLLDYGVHSPTIYFPHLVEEAFMIEPTDSESKEKLDYFIDAMIKIKDEPDDVIKNAPTSTSVGRVNEVEAARNVELTWKDLKE